MPTEGPDFLTTWRVICMHAWKDENFKNQLKDHPDEVLARFNFPPPPGLSYTVVENDPDVITLVLPAQPDAATVAGAADDRAVSQYYASCL